MKDKIRKIEKLNKTLESQKELGGTFLPVGVKEQFDIMFIAEMPSMKTPKIINQDFNFKVTARDRFFQEMLVKYGVGGSYVTDIVKERNIPRRPTKEEIKEWLPFLLKEIEIIDPRAIVVLGKRTYDASFKRNVEPFISQNIKIDYVFHYSSQVPRSKFEERFAEVVDRI